MNRVRLSLLRRAERRVISGAHANAAVPGERPAQGAAARPAPVGGESLFRRSDAAPQPTFTRVAPPSPPTRPIAGLAPAGVVADSRASRRPVRPYVSAGAPKTLVFDELAAEKPLHPFMSTGEQARLLDGITETGGAPGSDVMFYSGDGWAGALVARRLRTGEWEDPQAGLDQIATRTAAGFTTARGHLRETLAGGWRSVRELAGQDPAGTGPQRAAAGGTS